MYSRWIFEVKEIRNFVCVQLVVIVSGMKEKNKKTEGGKINRVALERSHTERWRSYQILSAGNVHQVHGWCFAFDR